MERNACNKAVINNAFYEELNDEWYTAKDHPIALLRAENIVRAPWVSDIIKSHFSDNVSVLDVGCGAGFLSNHLAQHKHKVTGIDISRSSLEVAKKFDTSSSVSYLYADAYQLPFEQQSFDVVCAMDILEHVENPLRLIEEASRVLKPGGLFFFHTFNRTWLSHLVVIKGVDWLVPNAPKNMHVYDLFITPNELKEFCRSENLEVKHLTGFMPDLVCRAFWKSVFTRKVDSQFRFKFLNNLSAGYCGYAIKSS